MAPRMNAEQDVEPPVPTAEQHRALLNDCWRLTRALPSSGVLDSGGRPYRAVYVERELKALEQPLELTPAFTACAPCAFRRRAASRFIEPSDLGSAVAGGRFGCSDRCRLLAGTYVSLDQSIR